MSGSAIKGYNNGVTYYKRKAYDSGIIYFRDVVKQYPKTDAARKSQIRLVQSYRQIKYKEDAAETCGTLEKNYPRDKEVAKACQGVKPTLVADTHGESARGRQGRAGHAAAESAREGAGDVADAGAHPGRACAGDDSSATLS